MLYWWILWFNEHGDLKDISDSFTSEERALEIAAKRELEEPNLYPMVRSSFYDDRMNVIAEWVDDSYGGTSRRRKEQ